ncbi:hypothetical protein ScPMuIL_009359 [Solemya velum]
MQKLRANFGLDTIKVSFNEFNSAHQMVQMRFRIRYVHQITQESGADLNDLETEENPVASINVQPYSFEPYESDISSNSYSGSSSTNGDIGDKSHMVTWTTRHEDIATQPTGSCPDGLGASLVKR